VSQAGQAIILIALIMIALLTGIGLAIDSSQGYYYSATAERAAAAGALSGVLFMPSQLTPAQAVPAGSGNDATDRAVNEAVRNGHGIVSGSVTVAAVSGHPNQLQVTVSLSVQTLFMRTFGILNYPVSRYSIAEYLTPITLGQPGSQTGSSVSQLGSGGNNFYFMRELGWSADRSQGDAFTPNPNSEYGATLIPGSGDQHSISGLNDLTDPNLPDAGGYNYLITLPAGGYIQVYNAVFGPDGNGGGPHNNCENARIGSKFGPIGPCSSGGSYYYHEEDGLNFGDATQYAAMQYTLLQVNNTFIHNTDTELAQMTVLPIDASNWNAGNKQYLDINSDKTINQHYNVDGTPSNMLIYHNWVDVTTYSGSGGGGGGGGGTDGGLVQRTLTYGSTQLPAGTYRLRVDTLDYDGSLPPGNQRTHKGYAIRALDTSGNPCAGCSVGAWADMCYYTPIASGGSFRIPIFQLPPTYAGKTVSVDVFDPGDLGSGTGNVDINILDPTGAIVAATPPATVSVFDLGVGRPPRVGFPPVLIGNPATASFRATMGGTTLYNGHWVELTIPIPSTYNPGNNPANWTFSLQYVTSSGAASTDTVTVAVGLAGDPAHLLVS
jgi:hypothetical protein